MTTKSSAPKGTRGRGDRLWRWLLRRVKKDRTALVKLLATKLPEQWKEGDCILWQGCCNPNGYPRLTAWQEKRLYFYAHHIFWTLANRRPIPDEFELGHDPDKGCSEDRRCVNPDHLTLMTRDLNLRQRNARHKWKNGQASDECPF